MKNLWRSILLGMCFVGFTSLAGANERGNAAEATAMVSKAVAYLKQHGKDKAFAEFSNPANKEFHDRDLYIFVYDMNGTSVAHSSNPKMVGKNLMEMKDADGKPIIRSFVDAANKDGKGWIDYKWPNPVTKAVENKSGYIEKVDGLIVGSGIYK